MINAKQYTPLMNNTKWREFFTHISTLPVYLQIQRLSDDNFHIDYEQADWVINEVSEKSFVYVNKEVEYKSLYAVKICKSVIPPKGTVQIINHAIELSKNLGQIVTSEDSDGFVILGYHS